LWSLTLLYKTLLRLTEVLLPRTFAGGNIDGVVQAFSPLRVPATRRPKSAVTKWGWILTTALFGVFLMAVRKRWQPWSNMKDLISGLEMIAAFLLTPVVLTLVMLYCERHVGRAANTERGLRTPNKKIKV
jgi:hypothetical protein